MVRKCILNSVQKDRELDSNELIESSYFHLNFDKFSQSDRLYFEEVTRKLRTEWISPEADARTNYRLGDGKPASVCHARLSSRLSLTIRPAYSFHPTVCLKPHTSLHPLVYEIPQCHIPSGRIEFQ
ncbi:unnamed protein product [Nezara viridula]|uniref:Uncharacterized protein n=1 Tax=Nezara viridula TaxID=85310 RepID=A0A9P0HBC1_NEZVI|nr:unnamed protein product [Nezara viridula]